MGKSKQVDIEEFLQAKLDKNGHEVVSSVPMSPPLGYVKSPSISERIRAMVQSEFLRQEAERAGAETFEEADDFAVDDDNELKSPYEIAETTGEVEVVAPKPAEPDRAPLVGGDPAKEPEPAKPEARVSKPPAS